MDRDEQIGVLGARKAHTVGQLNKAIAVAGERYAVAAVLQHIAQLQGDVEHDILLSYPIGANGAGIASAMAGVDDNGAATARRGRRYDRWGRDEVVGDKLETELRAARLKVLA